MDDRGRYYLDIYSLFSYIVLLQLPTNQGLLLSFLLYLGIFLNMVLHSNSIYLDKRNLSFRVLTYIFTNIISLLFADLTAFRYILYWFEAQLVFYAHIAAKSFFTPSLSVPLAILSEIICLHFLAPTKSRIIMLTQSK